MIVIAGCQAHVTNLPQGVPENEVRAWIAATGAVKVIADSTKGVTDSVIALNAADPKVIPSDDYQKILLVLGKTAQTGIHVDNVLKQAPSKFGDGTKQQILAEIQPLITQMQAADLEGIFSRSQSPRMQAELVTVQTITQSAQLLLALVQ
ncbi:MAG TPA: hypothetical protein VMJ66_02180 [Geobacteraceae bacterium]|nr:hypothetical protein [Geobacteraceae bacterium]